MGFKPDEQICCRSELHYNLTIGNGNFTALVPFVFAFLLSKHLIVSLSLTRSNKNKYGSLWKMYCQ